MVKYVKFKQFLIEHNVKKQDVAKLLGINACVLSNKLNTENSDFTLSQVRKLCNYYHISCDLYFMN